jgi:hypothetical protein
MSESVTPPQQMVGASPLAEAQPDIELANILPAVAVEPEILAVDQAMPRGTAAASCDQHTSRPRLSKRLPYLRARRLP